MALHHEMCYVTTLARDVIANADVPAVRHDLKLLSLTLALLCREVVVCYPSGPFTPSKL